jgi:hypothetical protein
MNIETLNNVIGNTLNRVIAKAIDSIGALPVGGKYIFAASNPFTLLVQRDAFADYPTVIFQDVKTGKDFFALKDVSKKSREDLQNAIINHVQKTGINSDNLQFLSFNEFLIKSFDKNRINYKNPIRIKIFDVLRKLDKKEMTVLLKNRVFDTWIKDNLNPIIKDIKDSQIKVKVENAIRNALFNIYEKNKSEGSKLQTKKENELKIKIKKFVSNIIEELRAEKRDKKATPKTKTTSKSAKKINRKINPDKVGFLVRKTPSGFVNEPKNKFTIYENEKLPGLKFFVGKVDNKWQVFDLTSGLPLVIQSEVGSRKSDIIKETDEKIEKYGAERVKELIENKKLPKEQLDIVMKPYKLYSKPKISKTTTPKKQTIKKTVKAKPKKVSSSIETCSDAGRLLRVKKSSSAGRKLAICRWK